jgi:hypothetical protein
MTLENLLANQILVKIFFPNKWNFKHLWYLLTIPKNTLSKIELREILIILILDNHEQKFSAWRENNKFRNVATNSISLCEFIQTFS